jgi:hypothetical protein
MELIKGKTVGVYFILENYGGKRYSWVKFEASSIIDS